MRDRSSRSPPRWAAVFAGVQRRASLGHPNPLIADGCPLLPRPYPRVGCREVRRAQRNLLCWTACRFTRGTSPQGAALPPNGAHGVLAALPLGVVFAVMGFEQATQMAGEARDPQRTVPRAVIGAVIAGTVLYLALEIAFIGALNPGNLVHGWATRWARGTSGPMRRWPPVWGWAG
jgi:hypothetical protein